ncbi:MAG: magnesium transporter [Planctomycetes bacterium]|nr:magnesium transporter [Planctomycetota bacterium]
MSDDHASDRGDAVRALIDTGTEADLRMFLAGLSPQEVADLLETLDDEQREHVFPLFDTPRQASVLREVDTETSRDSLIAAIPDDQLADIVEHAASDDAADLVESIPEERRERVLDEVEDEERAAIEDLQRYAPDTAGGLMQKELLKVRIDQTVAEAVETIRREWEPKIGEVYDIYVVDADGRVQGRVRNRHLIIHPPHRRIAEIMLKDVRTVPVTMDQEKIAEIVQDYDLSSVAVVDEHDRLAGRILVDDIVDVIEEEATEDIHKMGGSEALGEPYLHVRFRSMVQKRAGWLAILFVGETLTASAMTYFEDEMRRAIVLGMFTPLIISSGGNSGSQATSLIIRAMALGEVRLADWWRVMRRELFAGFSLGCILAVIGMSRIMLWHELFGTYPDYPLLLAVTVGLSLIGIVTWGTLAGSMLPFLLRRLGFDPAHSSAPFVATLVDVSGLVIYFVVAMYVLKGTLL